MVKKYTMNEATAVAKIAARDIEEYLRKNPKTLKVENVEDIREYREKDIDLIWTWINDGVQKVTTIEIKGDRYYRTGNYFLETISNKEKNTPGCILYTEADLVFYYFVFEKELHILPMPRTRDWFLNNINRFVEKETTTPVGNNVFYTTVGRLVKRDYLQNNIKGVKIISLKESEDFN